MPDSVDDAVACPGNAGNGARQEQQKEIQKAKLGKRKAPPWLERSCGSAAAAAKYFVSPSVVPFVALVVPQGA